MPRTTGEIADAWGILYDFNDIDPRNSYVVDQEESFWLRTLPAPYVTSTRREPFDDVTGVQLFKIRIDGQHMHISSLLDEGLYIDGQNARTKHAHPIHNGRCNVLVKDHKLHLVFEALCNVEGNTTLVNMAGKYRFISILGRGGFGIVYKSLSINEERFCAMKVEQKNRKKLRNEHDVVANLLHPNIIEVIEFQEISSQQYLVFEMARGGSLHQRIKYGDTLSEADTRFIFRQVGEGLAFIHSQGAMHRDIKPENIVFMDSSKSPVVKIIDFGVSCFEATATDRHRVVGAYRFLAPELLIKYTLPNKNVPIDYSNKVDVWSLGVSLFLTLTGVMPYTYTRDLVAYRNSMVNGEINKDNDQYRSLSRATRKVIAHCLALSEAQRPHMAALMKSTWFRSKPLVDFDENFE